MASLIFFFFFLLLFPFCISTNTLNPNQTIEDGQTLVSPAKIFALGFFSPGNSKNRYLGIWYNQIPDKSVVWVANRENPYSNSSGILSITGGNLKLIDSRDHNLLWSTNVSTVRNYSSTATLMDSGNLVLKDDRENIIWESFDHPTHVYLPGMKMGFNQRTGLNRVLTSWKSAEDPARGEFRFGFYDGGMPQFFLMKGSDRMVRPGPWNGERISSKSHVSPLWKFRYVDNDDEIYITYSPYDSTLLSRLVLNQSGVVERFIWSDKSRQWIMGNTIPSDRCDNYARCGPYGSCDPSQLPESECKCLQGFKPKSAQDWLVGDWIDGCMRREPLDCGKGDGFLRLARVKLPDTSRSVVEPSLSLQGCKDFCLKNCSCTAYASANISGEGSGCVIWVGDLIDLKVFTDGGQEMYTRVSASELGERPYKRSRGFPAGMKKLVVSISIVASVVLAFIACSYCWWKKAKVSKVNNRSDIAFNQNDFEDIGKSSKLSLFHLNNIVASTNNFSEANMLGRGGFGAVFKGNLLNGQEIAVKRLSMNSGQGIEEFKNEVSLIAKLQHKNLVRLLGCCVEGEEKMLVYEYMHNKSLDSFIFDETRRAMLVWRKRFSIIMGIARGVLYLHEDSRLRIIHRDLKVSNVLLDKEMNPKISDFGLARIFGGNQTQAKTDRVIGTYGYMAPEYALNGLFSIKSDVFSFGVILLEIISGKRNNYCDDCHFMTLIEYAWELWKEGKTLELVDSLISDSCCQIEVSRCIEVGLLCVQESASDRPNMSSVFLMLGNEVKVPSPKKPTFFPQKEESYNHVCYSNNDVTITEMEARW